MTAGSGRSPDAPTAIAKRSRLPPRPAATGDDLAAAIAASSGAAALYARLEDLHAAGLNPGAVLRHAADARSLAGVIDPVTVTRYRVKTTASLAPAATGARRRSVLCTLPMRLSVVAPVLCPWPSAARHPTRCRPPNQPRRGRAVELRTSASPIVPIVDQDGSVVAAIVERDREAPEQPASAVLPDMYPTWKTTANAGAFRVPDADEYKKRRQMVQIFGQQELAAIARELASGCPRPQATLRFGALTRGAMGAFIGPA